MPRVREPGGPGAGAGDPGESAGGPGEHPAARLLRDAYPSARAHDRAVRWLTWIAWQLNGRRDLAWWEIPGWVGEPWLRHARTLTGAVLLGLAFALGFGGYGGPTGLAVGGLAAVIAVYIGNRLRPGPLRRGPELRAMVPAWPRTRRDIVVLALAAATGLFLRPVLIRLWARPAAGPPSASYRACRRSTVIDVAACLLTGLPLAVAGLAAGEVGLAALAAAPAGFAVLTALADGQLPALRQAELALLVRRRHPVSFGHLLDGAADRQVLIPAGAYYQFRDPSVQRYLHGLQQSVADDRNRRAIDRKQRIEARERRIDAAAAGKHGARPWLLGRLTPGARSRLAVDTSAGAGLATLGRLLSERVPDWHAWSAAVLGSLGVIVSGLLLAFVAFVSTVLLLDRLAWSLRWSLWLTGRLSRGAQVATAAAAVAAAGLLTAVIGPGPVRHGIAVTAVAVMPAVTVAVVGGGASAAACCGTPPTRCWPW